MENSKLSWQLIVNLLEFFLVGGIVVVLFKFQKKLKEGDPEK